MMIENKFNYVLTNEKLIERIIADGNVHLNHMILPKGDRLAEHYSNSNVYMIIVKGKMTIELGDQKPNGYEVGEILRIPYNIKMNVYNEHEEVLEFFVVKAPNPENYNENA